MLGIPACHSTLTATRLVQDVAQISLCPIDVFLIRDEACAETAYNYDDTFLRVSLLMNSLPSIREVQCSTIHIFV